LKRIAAITALVFSAVLSAQTVPPHVTLTATIKDANGHPYSKAFYQVQLIDSAGRAIPGTTRATYQGQPVSPTSYNGNLDSTGTFTASVVPNNATGLFPTTTRWQINISAPNNMYLYNDARAWSIQYATAITADTDLSSTLSALAQPVSYIDVNGPSAFLQPVYGMTPTDPKQLATKGYVDAAIGGQNAVQSGTQYQLPVYTTSLFPQVGPSNITIDATGNNLTVPGTIAVTGAVQSNSIASSPSTAPVCPNGTGGALTTSGCVVGIGTVGGQTPGNLPLATGTATIGKSSPLSVDDVNTPTVVTSTVPINAPALNGVYNVKAAFGASGSNQTMTCTATASSANLTSCTGGETQAAQTQAVVSGSSAPWVNTTVSWTSETNVSVWLIYKSINGGPYNYYTMVYEPSYGTTLTDNGTVSSLQFNCNDDGVPCVAPSGATSNDVFAQITNISGGTYTLAAGTNQASFRTGFGLSGQLPSRPGTSGTFVVQHDDEPAFIAAYQYLLANSATQLGQVELHIPSGVYNLHLECGAANSCYSVNPTAISFSGLKNVTFAGDGVSTVLNASLDRSSRLSLFMGAYCGSGAPGACSAMYATYSTGPGPHVFVANDPIPVGSYSLTMTTAGDAANFPAGSWLQIFPNNQPYPCGKAIDTNQVLTSDSTTGILTLLYPVARYYSATLPAPWSQSACASWAPVVGQMTGGLAASHITFKNMHVRADMLFESTSAVDFLTVEGMQIEDNATEETGQDRHITYTRNVITEGGNQGTNLRGILTAAFGSEDMTASYNTFTAPSYSATDNQNCVEHSANVSYIGNTMTFAGVGKGLASNSLGGAISVASGCDNFQFLRNTVNLWSTDTKSAIYIQGGVVNGQVRDNNFFVDAISQTSKASAYVAALMSGNNPIVMSGNNWTIGSGTPNTPLVTPSTHIQPGFRTIAYTSGSGTVRGDFQYGGANIFTDTLTGNVTTVILGQNRIAGYAFSIQLTQAAAGGPYTLPNTCASTGWSLGGGNGIDCPFGPPVVNPTASSLTVLSFFDDGATVHYIGTDYTSTTNLSDWTNSGVANGYIPIWE
jgi:hypothetical protein